MAEEPALPAGLPPDLPIAFGGPFELVDHDGAPRSDRDFRGRYMLIEFGYTYCPDICPISLDAMSAALEMLGNEAERIQPLFVTVDPARDRPEVLKAYLGHFHPRLIGLTGEEKAIARLANAYRVHRMKIVPEGTDPGDYLVDHGSITYLMGPDGRFVTLFPYGSTADFMADAIARHLRSAAS